METESSNSRILKLLAKNYENSEFQAEYTRHDSLKHTNLSQRFYVKDKNYKIQYSHIYFNRLMLTRVLLDNKLKALDVKPRKVINITPNSEEVCVVGTLFKENKLKPSVLHRINEYKLEIAIEPGRFSKRTSKDDYMYLEDETGRVRLSFDDYQEVSPSEKNMVIVEKDYTAQELVTGIIAALIGRSDTLGTFFVHKILFCDVPKNANEGVFNRVTNEIKALESPMADPFGNFYTVSDYMDGSNKRRTNGMDDEFIAIIAGLNYSFNDDPVSLKKLKQFLLGGIPGSNTRQFISKISRVIFAGDVLKEEKELKEDIHGAFKVEEAHAKAFIDMKKSFSDLDGFFTDLSKSVNVDLMPGVNDPTDDTWPQQPLNRAYFPRAYTSGTFNSMTNPYNFRLGDVNILGTSGANVLDVMHYLEFSDKEIDIMEASLYWRQLAPTAPDTLKCHPFDKDDPFFIEELPHIMFAGNMRSFDTRLFYQEKSKKICRLVTVPIFSETGSFVIVNLKNLDTFEIEC